MGWGSVEVAGGLRKKMRGGGGGGGESNPRSHT